MQLKLLFWCCFIVAAPHTALAQVQPDDAGDTVATAGVLHAGVNTCRSDYLLPRRMDVDVWALRTEVGKVYRISSHPVDDVTEALWSLPLSSGVWSYEQGLRVLGYEPEPYWIRGNGATQYFTIKGIARVSGAPCRYEIVADEQPDEGDPEPNVSATAIPLTEGVWQEGTASPPGPVSGYLPGTDHPIRPTDIDCFSFAYADRGIYRLEVEPIGVPSLAGLQVTGGASRRLSSEPDALLGPTYIGPWERFEMRGPGVLGVTITRAANGGPQRIAYRLRITQLGTAAPDDHGNVPSEATPIVPDGHEVHGLLGSLYTSGSPPRPADADWFAVQTQPHHAYLARVERGGLYPLSDSATALKVVVPAAEGGIGFHDTPLYFSFNVVYPLKTLRFRGRDDGGPVRFGLTGPLCTYKITVTDLGVVTDSGGDQLTQPGHLTLGSPVTGALDYPTDVDSFEIDPPAAAGHYRLEVVVPAVNNPGVLYPGVAVVTNAGPGASSQQVYWHSYDTSFPLTRRVDGTSDSFPARIDVLNKTYPPQATFPTTGVVYHYTLRLVYEGPLDLFAYIPPSGDEAPSTRVGAPVISPGEHVHCSQQGQWDSADVVLVPLISGHLYVCEAGSWPVHVRVFAPGGEQLHTDEGTSPGFPFRTVQRFVPASTGLYEFRLQYTAAYTAWQTDLGVEDEGLSGDVPCELLPIALRQEFTRGRFDHENDRDYFYLPYEQGALYRVSYTSDDPSTISFGTGYYPAPSPSSFLFFMPNQPLQNGMQISVASAASGGSYELRLEKVLQVKPSDDIPGDPELAPLLVPGAEVMMLNDHPLDVDTFRIAVQAGHQYRLRGRYIGGESYDASWVWMTLRDGSGRDMDSGSLGHAIQAFEDGVWHADMTLPSIPLMVSIVDEGVRPDDIGTVEGTRGHVAVGETRHGVLEFADDVDLWEIDGVVDTPTNVFTVTVLAGSGEVLSSYSFDTPWNAPLIGIERGGMPPDVQFPLEYTVSVTESNVTPPTQPAACPGDFGSTGGRPMPDHMHDTNDLVVFIDYFFRNYRLADVGSAGGEHTPDGWLDNNDFVVMVDLYFTECP